MLLLLLLSFLSVLAGRAIFLGTNEASRRAEFYANSRTASTLLFLKDEVSLLQKNVERIDELSIKEIREYLRRVTTTLVRAQEELDLTYEQWRKLDLVIRAGEEKYSSLKTDIERLSAAKQDQLSYAAQIFAEATAHDAFRSFALGVFLSFPIGVFSSVAANYIWLRLRKRAPGSSENYH